MASNRKYACAVLAGIVLAAHSWAAARDRAESRALAVVVHKTSGVENLSVSELRKMLTGELSKWPDSSAVVVIEQPAENATQLQALKVLLKTTPAGYNRQLLQAQFQGKQQPTIKVLNSDETAVKFVWNVPGAVAVVDATAAASATSRVKILRLDGKLPGEPGYVLQ